MGNLLEKNLAMLGKYRWRYSTEEERLWKIVLKSIEGLDSNLASYENFAKCKSKIWCDIKDDSRSEQFGMVMLEGITNELGKGNKIFFWSDVWVGEETLKDRFPRLFILSSQKNHRVTQMGSWNGHVWSWSLLRRRGMFEWEKEQETEMRELISTKVLRLMQ